MSECLTFIPCPLCGNGNLHAPPSLQALEEAATKYFVIPRAQYEALMAAVEENERLQREVREWRAAASGVDEGHKTVVSAGITAGSFRRHLAGPLYTLLALLPDNLRAAGIDTEESNQ